MNIIYVYPCLIDRAGTERVWVDKMNYLAERCGYEIMLVTYEQANRPFVYPLSDKVRHVDFCIPFSGLYRFNRLHRLYLEFKLQRSFQRLFNSIMESVRPDIVVASTYFSKILSVVVKCPVNTFRVLESHIDKQFFFGNVYKVRQSFPNRMRFMFEKWQAEHCARRFDLLVSLTKEDAVEWSPYVKTTVIPNVVHLCQNGKHSDNDAKRVIFAGRLEAQKGISDLLQAWQFVYAHHPEWHLDIYGNGSLEAEIRSEVARLNMNIHLNPAEADIMDRYCEHSIFVLSSVFEPFGLVLVEAMSCGLPVVAFDCPYGPRSIITDGVDGFLVENRNIKQFADAIIRLMEDKELRLKMGQKGILTSCQYSAEHIMPQWVELFNQLVGSSSDGR
jgi:glycosyltransferase involved in cell wall biosynthesis